MSDFRGFSFRYRIDRKHPSSLNYRIKVIDGEDVVIYDSFSEIARKYRVSPTSVLSKFNGKDVKKLSNLIMKKHYN